MRVCQHDSMVTKTVSMISHQVYCKPLTSTVNMLISCKLTKDSLKFLVNSIYSIQLL